MTLPPPEPLEVREHWRQGLAEYLARRERTRKLRAELAAARTAGKARRHADRLARLNRQAGENVAQRTELGGHRETR